MSDTEPVVAEGIKRIAAERQRQIEKEDYTPEHDDGHEGGQLVLAAIAYAAPVLIYRKRDYANSFQLSDPFPWSQGGRGVPNFDKRLEYGTCKRNPGNVLPDPNSYTDDERLDLLVKAGALIAAEIDRLLRRREKGITND